MLNILKASNSDLT